MRRDTDELLAAYADDGELSADEKRRVEHLMIRDAGARADEAQARELLGKLRELPKPSEPDWNALERSIRLALPDEIKRPWWRTWRLAIPGVALAGIAALVFVLTRPPVEETVVAVPEDPKPAPIVETVQAEDDVVAVYLDGDDLELPLDSDLADSLDDIDLGESLGFAEARSDAQRREESIDDLASDGFLGDDDLAWIDELDDADLEAADGWLEHHHRKGS